MLITEAPASLDEQFAARRRRYSLLMGSRVVFLIAAACTLSFSLWLAVGMLAAGAVLPWCAVLIANDRPPRKAEKVSRLGTVPSERAIAPSADASRIIEG